MRGRFIAVILSSFRPGLVVRKAITAAASEPAIDEVHVWGYNPTDYGTTHQLPRTLYHEALADGRLRSTTDYMCKTNKFCGTDGVTRTRWRAQIALNMWVVLSEARDMFPDDTLLYLENDALLIKNRIRTARAETENSRVGAASCYRPYNIRTYQGSGNLCFILTPKVDPAPHLLAYHLVQPADWIVSDFSRGLWPVYNCVSHGVPGQAHGSTRDIVDTFNKLVCHMPDGSVRVVYPGSSQECVDNLCKFDAGWGECVKQIVDD